MAKVKGNAQIERTIVGYSPKCSPKNPPTNAPTGIPPRMKSQPRQECGPSFGLALLLAE